MESEAATGPQPTRGFWPALAACLVGIALLLGLGTWQVERLAWKQDLIARIDQRIHAAPVDLDTLRRRAARGEDVDYTPAVVAGRFLHEGERYFLSTFEGRAGWNVYTPLITTGGDLLFVNRGFVPYELMRPETRPESLLEAVVEVKGLARDAPAAKSGYFVPDNDPAKRIFFWRDIDAMAEGLPLAGGATVLPFFLDAGPSREAGILPIGGTTVVDIPNSHLQYAVAWYGIALVLTVMTALLVLRRIRGAPEA